MLETKPLFLYSSNNVNSVGGVKKVDYRFEGSTFADEVREKAEASKENK